MSVKNTIRRLVKQLTASGHVTASYEGTMMMVDMGDKGYDNKWPTRPHHQKNGSMRNKRRIRNKVNGFKETNVTIFTGVYPVAAPVIGENENGQITVSTSFTTTAAVGDCIDAAAHVLHGNPEKIDVAIRRPMAHVELGETGHTPIDLVEVLRGAKIPPGLNLEHWNRVVNQTPLDTLHADPAFKAVIEQPITSIIAVDPGTPGYPIQGQFSRDPVTGELKLDMISVVPPGEGHPTMPVPKKDSWLYEALGGPDVPDGNRDFFNIWTGQGPANPPIDPAVISEVALTTQRSSLHELVSDLVEQGPSPDFVNLWSVADADVAGIPPAERASMNEAMSEFAKSIDLKDPATAPIGQFVVEPSYKEDFTQNTESTNLSEKIDALMNGVVLTQEQRAERLQTEAGDIINEITAALNIYSVDKAAELPEVGDESVFYYVNSLELFFHWDGKDYMPISPASREGNRIVEVAFPQREAAAKETLDHPEQSDSRSWGRRVWDMIVGKDRG